MVNQDGTYSILARICDLTCIKQADVSVISCEILDLGSNRDNPSGSQVTPNPTMTAAANIFDTLQTNGWPTREDPNGYNFRHDIGVPYTLIAGNWYLYECRIVLVSGSTSWIKGKVQTLPTQTPLT
jgi:hypothetical protein